MRVSAPIFQRQTHNCKFLADYAFTKLTLSDRFPHDDGAFSWESSSIQIGKLCLFRSDGLSDMLGPTAFIRSLSGWADEQGRVARSDSTVQVSPKAHKHKSVYIYIYISLRQTVHLIDVQNLTCNCIQHICLHVLPEAGAMSIMLTGAYSRVGAGTCARKVHKTQHIVTPHELSG